MPFVVGVTLPFLGELVALLAGSVGVAYVCYRLRLVPIAGFLLAGVLVGPGGLGLVDDQALINAMAEVGVILLLFTIGLEFSLDKLARISRSIFVGGGVQVGVTVALVAAGLLPFGVSPAVAVFTGCLVALSSTAIVLSLLADRNEMDAPAGRQSLAILIFQDLAIVAMVLLVPLLAGEGGSPGAALLALGQAVGLVALVVVGARRVVPWLLERVARTRRSELFLLTIVALCFGTAWLTNWMGVSLALGAFLAGLVVSESRYSTQALSEVLPLRTLFNAVFFVSVGMLLDVDFVLAQWPLVLGVALAVLLVKVLITGASVLALGYPVRIAAAVGLALAQIGEFSFVLERSGQAVGLTPAGLGAMGGQTFIAVTVLLMVATPLLVQLGAPLGRLLERTRLRHLGTLPPADPPPGLEDHTIIVGYGPVGERLVRVMADTGLPYVVVELNPIAVREGQRAGLPILYGDASRPAILGHVALDRAKLLVVAISDEAAAERVVHLARFHNPTIQILVRTRFIDRVEPLQKAGADVVVPEELETAVRLFSHVLGAYFVPPDEIERQVAAVRAGDYQVFRGRLHEAHLMVLQGLDEEGLHTRAVAVRPGAAAAGRSLAELALRPRYGLTVLAVRRSGHTIGNPAGDFRVEVGDRLVLVGLADNFAKAADLFRPAPAEAAP